MERHSLKINQKQTIRYLFIFEYNVFDWKRALFSQLAFEKNVTKLYLLWIEWKNIRQKYEKHWIGWQYLNKNPQNRLKWKTTPTFETSWSIRLIPGKCQVNVCVSGRCLYRLVFCARFDVRLSRDLVTKSILFAQLHAR